MRTRSGRSFVVLPFSLGCTSRSSVALGSSSTSTTQTEKLPPQAEPNTHASLERRREKGNHESSSSQVKRKKSLGFWVLPKFNIFIGLQKLVGSLRSLSQIFVYKEEMDEKEEEEEMEIGFPTDVKHVTHIGLDGSTATMATIKGPEIKSWENLETNPHELCPFPSSISLKQFEFAMAAQAHDRPPPLGVKLSENV